MGILSLGKILTRLSLLAASLCWIGFLAVDEIILFVQLNNLPVPLPLWSPRVLFVGYLVLMYFYFRSQVEKEDTVSFTNLLWRVFVTGLVTMIVSLALRLIMTLLGQTNLPSNLMVAEFIFQANLALLLTLLMVSFVSWKQLILYQKTKKLVRLWVFFELALISFLILEYLPVTVTPAFTFLSMGAVGLMALALISNVKWVVYLTIRQKWTGLLLLLLTLFYVLYFMYSVLIYADAVKHPFTTTGSFPTSLFSISLTGFVALYSAFSFLVLLFNLPTSSVFEQKLEEVITFQRISQSVHTEQNEESVYHLLVDSCVNTVFADASWVELIENEHVRIPYALRLSVEEAKKMSDHIKKMEKKRLSLMDRARDLSRYLPLLKGKRFQSILTLPLLVNNKKIGALTLLKEMPNGFNKEMRQIVSTFVTQAGISIENFRLMAEAIRNERYQEELKIAQHVQKSLLPEKLETDTNYDMVAFSHSADEVGGDYYDSLRLDDHCLAWIIADVSGKGTTAAFHMSQMKGVFHSLAQLKFDPSHFMIWANGALIRCLDRGRFISAIYLVTDTKEKKIMYSRAGHCPVLYYHAQSKEARFLEDKGIGLGMVRNTTYSTSISSHEVTYHSGDIMVLYTDGITEAVNKQKEEFGHERLATAVRECAHESSKNIELHILEKLYAFIGSNKINDDYTTVIVKFT